MVQSPVISQSIDHRVWCATRTTTRVFNWSTLARIEGSVGGLCPMKEREKDRDYRGKSKSSTTSHQMIAIVAMDKAN